MRILALKEVLDSPSGGWTENWGYNFLTEIQVYSDCSTKLHFFTLFFGNCNLEWCICSVVTCELFLCRHCPWTWSPQSLWKEEVKSPDRIAGCYAHIMPTFSFTQTELLFRDLHWFTPLHRTRKYKSPVFLRIQVRQGESQSSWRESQGSGILCLQAPLFGKRNSLKPSKCAQEQVWDARFNPLLSAFKIFCIFYLHPWLPGRIDKLYF